MPHNVIQNGETLVIPNDDPAVTVVTGYRRFLVGLDIAQSAATVDANAVSIILDEQVPHPSRQPPHSEGDPASIPAASLRPIGQQVQPTITAFHAPARAFHIDIEGRRCHGAAPAGCGGDFFH